jgi:hypothetical protein
MNTALEHRPYFVSVYKRRCGKVRLDPGFPHGTGYGPGIIARKVKSQAKEQADGSADDCCGEAE